MSPSKRLAHHPSRSIRAFGHPLWKLCQTCRSPQPPACISSGCCYVDDLELYILNSRSTPSSPNSQARPCAQRRSGTHFFDYKCLREHILQTEKTNCHEPYPPCGQLLESGPGFQAAVLCRQQYPESIICMDDLSRVLHEGPGMGVGHNFMGTEAPVHLHAWPLPPPRLWHIGYGTTTENPMVFVRPQKAALTS
jgi:hypothetical protein